MILLRTFIFIPVLKLNYFQILRDINQREAEAIHINLCSSLSALRESAKPVSHFKVKVLILQHSWQLEAHSLKAEGEGVDGLTLISEEWLH